MKLAFAIMIPWLIFSAFIGWEYGPISGIAIYVLGGLIWAAGSVCLMMAYDGRKKDER